jgi:predicted nucleotidyltransferase component of viral defense system
MDAIRETLDPWLGEPRRKRKQMLTTMIYRFDAETTGSPMRLKIEINQLEKQNLFDIEQRDFAVDTPWFDGEAPVRTYRLEELLGTKLRALYQRKKGRDLFDLWTVHQQVGFDLAEVVRCFRHYLDAQGLTISKAEFAQNLDAKLIDPDFDADVPPLLPGAATWDRDQAADFIKAELLPLL